MITRTAYALDKLNVDENCEAMMKHAPLLMPQTMVVFITNFEEKARVF